MNTDLLELYSDYLLSAFGHTTATGLSAMTNGAVSHDNDVRVVVIRSDGDPAAIVEREGLAQISDSGELEGIVAKLRRSPYEPDRRSRSRCRGRPDRRSHEPPSPP